MLVPVVNVRIVSVHVHQRLVPMRVSVWRRVGHEWVGRRMDVLMMFIVHVRVVMLRSFVPMCVLVLLGEM